MTDKTGEETLDDLSTNAKVQVIFDYTCALNTVLENSVIPVIKGMISRSQQEIAITGTYYRMLAWMKTLTELKCPVHIQAVCSAARGMFELLIDIKQLIATPALADAYHAFTFVRRFRQAQVMVEEFDKIHGTD